MLPNGYYSRWNIPESYSCNEENTVSSKSYPYVPFETASFENPEYYFTDDQINEKINNGTYDLLAVEITCRIATSKFLSEEQIYGYMIIQGICRTREEVTARLEMLLSGGFIRKVVCAVGARVTFEVYTLGFKGSLLGRAADVPFHKALFYVSPKKKIEMGMQALESPEEIRRILQGNQMLINWLRAGVKMQRFGFLECLRMPEGGNNNDLILRTTVAMRLDARNNMLVEVCRRRSEWQSSLINKISRFNRLVSHLDFLNTNSIEAEEIPQLLICCEDMAHTRETYDALYAANIFTMFPHFTPLFTHDQMAGTDPTSIFSYDADGSISFYSLPAAK